MTTETQLVTRQNLTKLIMVITAILLSETILAKTYHSLSNIEQTAYEFISEQAQTRFDTPQIVVNNLDHRLRLHRCEQSLESFLTKDHATLGNQTVGIKCSNPVPWTVYVTVKVKLMTDVVVASRSLMARRILTADDLTLQRIDISGLRRGYTSDTSDLIGQELRQSVRMGTIMNHNFVKPQKIIRRGDMITLIVSTNAMEVKMAGTAMSDAILGQKIQVKNRSSKRLIEGTVFAPGIVKVGL